MGFHHLSVAHEAGVGTVTLLRPPINAINGQVLDEIVTALEAWTDDPAVAAVVLTGGIRNAFCTGGDLQQLFGAEMAGLGREERMTLFERFQRIYSPKSWCRSPPVQNALRIPPVRTTAATAGSSVQDSSAVTISSSTWPLMALIGGRIRVTVPTPSSCATDRW